VSRIFETPLYPYRRSPDQDAKAAAHHPVIVVGAGPVGLTAAIDLAQQDIPVVILDENDRVSWGSRAICFAKRPLEILDRLGCGEKMTNKGVIWSLGKVFFGERKIYEFNLLPESGHRRPAFINLQQYYFETFLVDHILAMQQDGRPIEIRGANKVAGLCATDDRVDLQIETPEGPYDLSCDWLIACDGAGSGIRKHMNLDFVGRSFEDHFLIADVVMDAAFPTERWFWFDPPFNRGQSALLHKQPDHVWRIDLQLGWHIDKEKEMQPDRVRQRLKAMLGDNVQFDLEWVSIYSFQCRRMEEFHHGRVIFAGDSAHQVSPFGARGANSGIQDADNLVWKLKLVIEGKAPASLLQSYDWERRFDADINIMNSTRSTDFITPKSETSRLFRDAVLTLAEDFSFARPLVNSGRLSVPSVYDGSPLNGNDEPDLPRRTRPGAPVPDAPIGENGWLLDRLGSRFQLLAVDLDVPSERTVEDIGIETIAVRTSDDPSGAIGARFLGDAPAALYLLRPDQHIAARWKKFDTRLVEADLRRAMGKAAAK
jgi:3-(3-hydroxy-phenyl)propionate hydroxylase